jgi:hypothetical protein
MKKKDFNNVNSISFFSHHHLKTQNAKKKVSSFEGRTRGAGRANPGLRKLIQAKKEARK